MRDDRAAFSGGALDGGLTYAPTCGILALRPARGRAGGLDSATSAGTALGPGAQSGGGTATTPEERS